MAIRGRGPVTTVFQVHLLGPFAVATDGAPVPPAELGSRKGRTLLKLLLGHRGAPVAIDTLAEVLWGELPPAHLEANIATLVSRLRALLGADAIAGGPGGYWVVAGPRLRIDLDEAGHLVDEAEARLAAGEPALARSASLQALALLGRGRVLEDEPDPVWAEPAQREAEGLLGRGRRAAWRAALELGDHAGALEWAAAAVAADPYDEEAHRAVMLAHYCAGEAGAALAAYEQLRGTLLEELGADPGPDTEALYLAVLRGHPVPSEPVRARAPPRTTTEPLFVGRQAELEELARTWEAATAGSPGLVLVAGEAGIGKTRLARELGTLARETGGLVAEARCYEAERSLFLQPLAEAVRMLALALPPERLADAAGEAAGTLAELVPDLGRILRPLPYERAVAELEYRRSLEAVASFLLGLARRQPLLLMLDDLHEAGSSTVEFLHLLVRRISGQRVLVVATVRSEEGTEVLEALKDSGRVIELGPLGEEAVAELARGLGVEDMAGRVSRLTRGHTLFAVEVLRAAAEGGGHGDRDTVPASLRDAVLAGVRRAGREVEVLLRGAVVVGAAFELNLVADLLELPVEDVAGRAERALAAHLLMESGAAYEFANDLVREVLYDTTPHPTRAARHRRAADLLAGHPEAVALHAAAAGDWARAAAAWMQAAAFVSRFFANRDAERLLTEALAAAARVDDGTEARVCLERGRIREALGDYRAAFADHGRALELARSAGDRRLEAAALERMGWTGYYARDREAASDITAATRGLAEMAAAAPEARPSALVLAGRIRHSSGELESARAAFAEVLAGQPDDTTRALARHCLGFLMEHTDRYADALRLLDEATEECRQVGVLRSMLTSAYCAALAAANQGDFAGALGRLDALDRVLTEVEDPIQHARVATARSWVWRQLGDLGRARDLVEKAVGLLGADSGSHPGLHARLGLAECALEAGDKAEASLLLDGIVPQLDRDFAYKWRIELRHLELHARLDPEVAQRLLPLARERRSPKYEALALARLGRPDEATEVAERVGSDYLLAQVATGPAAGAALARLATGLPDALRARFFESGRLSRTR